MRIGIIGFGPRGFTQLQAIIDLINKNSISQKIEIFIFDKYFPSGHVWRTDQSSLLVMNTVAQEITLSFEDTNPFTMYDWARKYAESFLAQEDEKTAELIRQVKEVATNSYLPRALFGYYQKWSFLNLESNLPQNVNLTIFEHEVKDIDKRDDKFIVTLDNEDTEVVDQIIVSSGHTKSDISKNNQEFLNDSSEYSLKYLTNNFPGDIDLSQIKGGDNLIIRGMGLTFFDYITELSEGRGGTFERNASGKLTYVKSGMEPMIFAFSRRGLPLMPKGINQKNNEQHVMPRIITDEYILFHSYGRLKFDEFLNVFKRELEIEYYLTLVSKEYQKIKICDFTSEIININNSVDDILKKYSIKSGDKLDLDKFQQPIDVKNVDYQQSMIDRLSYIFKTMEEGNVDGPTASAIDMFRELRHQVRKIITFQCFAVDNGRANVENKNLEDFYLKFSRVDSFFSAGPPNFRYEELIALMEAGIVKISPTGSVLNITNGHFQLEFGDQSILSDQLIDAMIPDNNVEHKSTSLIGQLFKKGTLAEQVLLTSEPEKFKTGAISVNRENSSTINGIHIFGVPTDKFNWYTTVIPQVFTNDQNREEAWRIAQSVLKAL